MKKQFTILTLCLLFIQLLSAQEWIAVHPLTIETSPTGVMFDDNDNLFFISQGAGLFEVNNGINNLLSTAPVNSDLTTLQMSGQDIWVGGYGGGGVYNNNTWQNFTPDNDLQGYAIYDIDITNGAVWAAMENEGASYFNGTSWEHYNASSGILGAWHTCIAQSSSGEVYLGSNSGSTSSPLVNKFDGTSWTVIDIPGLDEITAIFVDNQDNVWVGGQGLLKFDGSNWTDYSSSLFDRNIFSIIEAPDGKIYFGMGNGGVGFLDGDVVTLIPVEDNFGFQGRPNGITFNSQGEVYFCMGPTNLVSSAEYGIYRFGEEMTSSSNDLENIKVELFPNPVVDNLSLQMEAQNYSIEIYSTVGNLVFNKKNVSKDETINITYLPTGMYVAKIEVGNQITSRKLIKQ